MYGVPWRFLKAYNLAQTDVAFGSGGEQLNERRALRLQLMHALLASVGLNVSSTGAPCPPTGCSSTRAQARAAALAATAVLAVPREVTADVAEGACTLALLAIAPSDSPLPDDAASATSGEGGGASVVSRAGDRAAGGEDGDGRQGHRCRHAWWARRALYPPASPLPTRDCPGRRQKQNAGTQAGVCNRSRIDYFSTKARSIT